MCPSPPDGMRSVDRLQSTPRLDSGQIPTLFACYPGIGRILNEKNKNKTEQSTSDILDNDSRPLRSVSHSQIPRSPLELTGHSKQAKGAAEVDTPPPPLPPRLSRTFYNHSRPVVKLHPKPRLGPPLPLIP